VPVVAVAGRTALHQNQLERAGIVAAYPLSDLEPDPVRSMANAASLLRRVGRRIAAEYVADDAETDLSGPPGARS
jgi:glycerate kinase